jgi:hypothetical protein
MHMPTYEELEAQLAQAIAARDLLSNELSNQAEQFAEWRRGMSDVATFAFETSVPAWDRVNQIKLVVVQTCGV